MFFSPPPSVRRMVPSLQPLENAFLLLCLVSSTRSASTIVFHGRFRGITTSELFADSPFFFGLKCSARTIKPSRVFAQKRGAWRRKKIKEQTKLKTKNRTDKRHKFGGFVHSNIIPMEACAHPKQRWFGEEIFGV